MGSISRLSRVGRRYRMQEPNEVGRLAVDMPDVLQEVDESTIAARDKS